MVRQAATTDRSGPKPRPPVPPVLPVDDSNEAIYVNVSCFWSNYNIFLVLIEPSHCLIWFLKKILPKRAFLVGPRSIQVIDVLYIRVYFWNCIGFSAGECPNMLKILLILLKLWRIYILVITDVIDILLSMTSSLLTLVCNHEPNFERNDSSGSRVMLCRRSNPSCGCLH